MSSPFPTQITSPAVLRQLAVTQPEELLEYIRELEAYRNHHQETIEGVGDVLKLLEEAISFADCIRRLKCVVTILLAAITGLLVVMIFFCGEDCGC